MCDRWKRIPKYAEVVQHNTIKVQFAIPKQTIDMYAYMYISKPAW